MHRANGRRDDVLADLLDQSFPEVVPFMEDVVFGGFDDEPATLLEFAFELAGAPARVAIEDEPALVARGDDLFEMVAVGREVDARDDLHL